MREVQSKIVVLRLTAKRICVHEFIVIFFSNNYNKRIISKKIGVIILKILQESLLYNLSLVEIE